MNTNQYGLVFPWNGRRQENPDRLRRAFERIADHHARRLGLERVGGVRLVVFPPTPLDEGTVGGKWLMAPRVEP